MDDSKEKEFVPEELLPKKDEFGRRKLIKKGLAVIVGGTIVSGLLGREAKNIIKGPIETKHGFFVPLYEEHSIGINEKQIPPDTNIFFVEGGDMTQDSPDILLSSGTFRERFISDEFLIRLANSSSEVMLGSGITPKFGTSLLITGAESFFGGAALFALTFGEKLGIPGFPLSRKQFLAALGGAVWGASQIPVALIPAIVTSISEDPIKRRIAARIYGLQSKLHPENTVGFFRDLIMAEKMLEAAKEYHERVGTKPKIAYEVGSLHGGTEDFLQAGQDITRALILAYPALILKDGVENNGGIEKFCSINLYKLPPNLTKDNLKERVRVETTRRNIVDMELAKRLEDKLG